MQIKIKKFSIVCSLAMTLPVFAAPLLQAAQAGVSSCDPPEEAFAREVQKTIERFQAVEPRTAELFRSAYGYVVFPRIEKGAAVIGGAYGEGLVYEGGKVVGQAKTTHITFGVQVGGGTYSEVIFFEHAETMNQFKGSEVMTSSQAAVAGAADSASVHGRDRLGLSVFTMGRTGVFLDASAGARKLTICSLAR
jgi:lipid-binding SYLF domain-containing protein